MLIPNLIVVPGGLLFLRSVVAQAAPSSWRKPTLNMSQSDRVSLATAGIQKTLTFLVDSGLFGDPDDTYGNGGTFYSQLAEFDVATNGSTYSTPLGAYFELANQYLGTIGVVNFTGEFVRSPIEPLVARALITYLRYQISDGINFGHAAAIAYKQYNNPQFLQYAEQSWSAALPFTVSQDDINRGNMSVKNFPLAKSCNGQSMVGSTFHSMNVSDDFVDGLSTGGFLVLSALLAEAVPSNTMYLEAAQNSANFIKAQLINSNNIVQDGTSASVCSDLSETTTLQSHNSGLMIEGLSILYSITANVTVQNLINLIATASMDNTDWQGPDGVIACGGAEKLGDMFLPRGLTAAYVRNATTPAVRSLIQQYLAVQFNAIQDNATDGDNIYGGSWLGPPSSVFSPGNQTDALQVLINAIRLPEETASNTSTSAVASPSASASASSPPAPAAQTRKHPAVGAIVGGTIGGCILIAGGILAFIVIRRRRLQQHVHGSVESQHPAPTLLRTASLPTGTIVPFDPYASDGTSDSVPSQPAEARGGLSKSRAGVNRPTDGLPAYSG
ncbi:hypothetical protein FB45DRAFT_1102990 [Roridomyces roridus]|uniref:Glycoside hydrolase family 76 protein n=1 Tax=Roridomyces roridus TaxID=1738132 RepID=A0AAD7FFX1_9AGAR|nr:hypothetical protein FB45DRAFT_1102990 [Roridomyces roridus]